MATATTVLRRYLTVSLRTLFVLLTIGCVWLAWKCEQARQQWEAVRAIEALRLTVIYDWQLNPIEKKQGVPKWLRRYIGEHPFEAVHSVWAGASASESDIQRAIPYLQRLPDLREVRISVAISQHTQAKLKASLPDCEIGFFGITHRMK